MVGHHSNEEVLVRGSVATGIACLLFGLFLCVMSATAVLATAIPRLRVIWPQATGITAETMLMLVGSIVFLFGCCAAANALATRLLIRDGVVVARRWYGMKWDVGQVDEVRIERGIRIVASFTIPFIDIVRLVGPCTAVTVHVSASDEKASRFRDLFGKNL